jgi:hypothetical protein
LRNNELRKAFSLEQKGGLRSVLPGARKRAEKPGLAGNGRLPA